MKKHKNKLTLWVSRAENMGHLIPMTKIWKTLPEFKHFLGFIDNKKITPILHNSELHFFRCQIDILKTLLDSKLKTYEVIETPEFPNLKNIDKNKYCLTPITLDKHDSFKNDFITLDEVLLNSDLNIKSINRLILEGIINLILFRTDIYFYKSELEETLDLSKKRKKVSNLNNRPVRELIKQLKLGEVIAPFKSVMKGNSYKELRRALRDSLYLTIDSQFEVKYEPKQNILIVCQSDIMYNLNATERSIDYAINELQLNHILHKNDEYYYDLKCINEIQHKVKNWNFFLTSLNRISDKIKTSKHFIISERINNNELIFSEEEAIKYLRAIIYCDGDSWNLYVLRKLKYLETIKFDGDHYYTQSQLDKITHPLTQVGMFGLGTLSYFKELKIDFRNKNIGQY